VRRARHTGQDGVNRPSSVCCNNGLFNYCAREYTLSTFFSRICYAWIMRWIWKNRHKTLLLFPSPYTWHAWSAHDIMSVPRAENIPLGGGYASDIWWRVRGEETAPQPLQVPSSPKRTYPPLVLILLTAAAYWMTGRLGLLFAIPPGYATAVWPPSGIALAAALVCGVRVLPGIMLGRSWSISRPLSMPPRAARSWRPSYAPSALTQAPPCKPWWGQA
jgi:hypothetical protein